MKTIPLSLFPFLFLACLTVRKDFNPKTIQPGEGTIVGRISINYNGMPRTGNCGVRLNGQQDLFVYFSQDGWFLANVPTGQIKFARMTCAVGSSGYFYDFKNVILQVRPYPVKTYAGDLMVNWETEGEAKASSNFGVIGAVADQISSDGVIAVAVKNNVASTQAEYRKKFPEDTAGDFQESIMNFAELGTKK